MKIFKKSREIEKLKYEFLPSALEIAETPPNPLGSSIIYFVFFIMLFFVLWASIGEVDIVAVSKGRVVPDGRVKIVQSLEEGVISEIHVEEGDRVKEGEVLISLDSTIKEVDEKSIKRDIEVAELEKYILNIYVKDKKNGKY